MKTTILTALAFSLSLGTAAVAQTTMDTDTEYGAGMPAGWDSEISEALFEDAELGVLHSEADVRTCLALAKRFDLGVSGGSDYHGSNKPTIRLGQGYGGLRVSAAVLESLKERRDAAGLHI